MPAWPGLSRPSTGWFRVRQHVDARDEPGHDGWAIRNREASHPDLRDEFGVEIGLDRLGAAFRAIARILDAAERHLREGEAVMVDRDHAGLDRGADRRRGLGRARIGV